MIPTQKENSILELQGPRAARQTGVPKAHTLMETPSSLKSPKYKSEFGFMTQRMGRKIETWSAQSTFQLVEHSDCPLGVFFTCSVEKRILGLDGVISEKLSAKEKSASQASLLTR